MKSFKYFIKEATGQKWQQSLSSLIFDTGREENFYLDVPIPLSSSIFKRVWPDDIRTTVFHLTDVDGLDKLVKLQGKKKSISAFTSMDRYYYSRGVQTEGGIVAEIDGNVLIAAPTDIMSRPDNTGRRWTAFRAISGREKFGRIDDLTIKSIAKDVEKLFKQLITTYYPDKLQPYSKKLANTQWQYIGAHPLSDKRKIIADYIDGMEKIIKKHSAKLRGVFTRYLDRRRTDDAWDEIIVNDIKIKQVHILTSDWAGREDESRLKRLDNKLKKLKIPAVMRYSELNLQDYIMKMADKESGREDE